MFQLFVHFEYEEYEEDIVLINAQTESGQRPII